MFILLRTRGQNIGFPPSTASGETVGRVPQRDVHLRLHRTIDRLLRGPRVRLLDLPPVRRSGAPRSLHVRQEHRVQPEIPGVRLGLQRGLRGVARLVLPQRSDVPRGSSKRGEAEKEEDAAAEEEKEQEKPSRDDKGREEAGLEGDGRHRNE